MSFLKNIFGKIRRSKGVTMLEMLLVLSIISVLLALATRYYLIASGSQKVSQAQAEITAIQGAIARWETICPSLQSCTINSKTYTFDINTLYTLRFLTPADLDGDQTHAVSPWGDLMTLSASDSGHAHIVFTSPINLPGCQNLASLLARNLPVDDTTVHATCDATGFDYLFSP